MKTILEKLYFVLILGEITGVIPRFFGETSASDAAVGHTTNPVLLVFVALAALGTIYYAFPKLPRIWRMLVDLRWALLLYAWLLLTFFWSTNRSITLFWSLRLVLYSLSAAFLALRYPIDELLRLVSRFFVGAAVLSLAGEFLLPALPSEDGTGGWVGIFPHKNWLGICMVIAITTILLQKRPWRPIKLGSVLLCAALLVLSQSFTAFLTAVATVFFMVSERVHARTKVIVASVLGVAFLFLLMLSNPLALLLSAGGKNSSFTGRDAVWAFSLKAILENPLLGYGYGAFWSDVHWTLESLHWSPPHAHNGLLQVCLDLGGVGLVLVLGMLINAWRRARRIQAFDPTPASAWMLTVLVMTFVHNLTEADLMLYDIVWFLIVVCIVSCLRVESEFSLPTLLEHYHADAEVAASV